MKEHEVFQLIHNDAHLLDEPNDADLLPFPNADSFGVRMLLPDAFEYPELIYGQGTFRSLKGSDFPILDSTDSAMSKRMFKILDGIQKLNAHQIPLSILDDTFLEDPFQASGELKPEVAVDDSFVILHLREESDVFDWDRSEYKMSRRFPEKVNFIKKVVLKEPKEGFSPIFRIPQKRRFLFVSAEAKAALEAAGIQRCVFKPIETT